MAKSSEITVAIIGTGYGKNVLAPAFRNDDRCKITHIVSSTADGAKNAARELKIDNHCHNWKEVCENPDVDLVAIATPPSMQPEIALSAIQNGKALLCEKPLARNFQEACKIQEMASSKNIAAVIDFEFPEIPLWQEAKNLLAENVIGDLRHIQYNWHVESYVNKVNETSWKTELENGGVLNLFGSHALYNIEWLFGRIQSLKASLLNLDKKGKLAEKNLSATMTLETQVPVTLSISNNSFPGTGQCISVYGESGSLHIKNESSDHIKGFDLLLYSRNQGKQVLMTEGGYGEKAKDLDGRILAARSIVKKLIDTIETSNSTSPNLKDGVRVQKLIDAVRLSSEEDRTIEIKTPQPQLSGAKK